MSKRKVTAEQIESAAWAAALTPKMVEDKVPPGWFTTKQLAKKLGKTRPTLARQMVEAVAAGKCEVRNFRINVGRFCRSTPHYRLK